MTTISLPTARAARRVAIYQLALLLSTSALLMVWESVPAYSVLLGGLIQICPQLWFVRQAFRFSGARRVQSIVRAMYWGETGKIVLTAVLFVTTFVTVSPLNVGALFSSFVIMILVQCLLFRKLLSRASQSL